MRTRYVFPGSNERGRKRGVPRPASEKVLAAVTMFPCWACGMTIGELVEGRPGVVRLKCGGCFVLQTFVVWNGEYVVRGESFFPLAECERVRSLVGRMEA